METSTSFFDSNWNDVDRGGGCQKFLAPVACTIIHMTKTHYIRPTAENPSYFYGARTRTSILWKTSTELKRNFPQTSFHLTIVMGHLLMLPVCEYTRASYTTYLWKLPLKNLRSSWEDIEYLYVWSWLMSKANWERCSTILDIPFDSDVR